MATTNHYLAVTAGPIYRTLSNVRRTRELWAASYCFTYLMKGIAKKLHNLEYKNFIIPYTNDEVFKHQKDGVGRFPDRLIFQANNPDKDKKNLENAIAETLDDFSEQVCIRLKINNETEKANVNIFFKDYFQLYIVSKNLAEVDNPVLKISPAIEVAELKRSFSLEAKEYLDLLLTKVTTSFLVEDAFGKTTHFFDSVVEVALREFKKDSAYLAYNNKKKNSKKFKEEQNDEETLVLDIAKSNKNKFRISHKYIAIVHADGDGIGKIIEAIRDTPPGLIQNFHNFSQKLSDYSSEATKMISRYGGMPVYAGGDDLLFFAPVYNKQSDEKDTKDIFSLLDKLNSSFKKKMGNGATLSFGLSISYYKFPLAEAVETSRDLMFLRAKKTTEKNCISFKVLKHSGAYFEADLRIGSETYLSFTELLDAALRQNKDLLSSVMYRIRQNEELIRMIGNDTHALKAFFDNSFNERVHKTGVNKDFLDAVKLLIPQVFKEIQGHFFTDPFIGDQLKKNQSKAEIGRAHV